MIEAEALTKAFGGIVALKSLDLVVSPGRLTGLIGPNGAGKTTMLNCIAGVYSPTGGSVVADGVDITNWRVSKRVTRLGLMRTFQKVRLFQELDPIQNVILGGYRSQSYGMGRALVGRRKAIHQSQIARSEALLAESGLPSATWFSPVSELGHGQQRLVELARTMAAEPKYLLLDEPTAGMNEVESRTLARWMRDRVDAGIGVLLISHDMPLVMRNCDDVIVMNFGERLASGTPEEIREDDEVIAAYLGRRQDASSEGKEDRDHG